MRGRMGALLAVLTVSATASVARAQCSTDQECKGDRICEAGQCTAPRADAAPGPALAAPAPAPAAVAVDAPTERERFFEPEADEKPRKVEKRIGNPSLMIGGIVLASAAPIVLAIGVMTSSCYDSSSGTSARCDSGSVLTAGLIAVAMVGAAVPMIVIGAKRVPVRQVAVGPLLGPGLSGLQLQLRL